MKKNFLRHFCSSHNSKAHPNKTFENLLQVQNPNPCRVNAQIATVEVLKIDCLKLRQLI